MDQAAGPAPAQNPDAGVRRGRNRTPGRRDLLQRPVRAMQVVMVGVLAEDQPQVPLAGDQYPVQALTASAGDPAFRDCVRPWRPHRALDDPHTDGSEDRAGCGGELGVPVPDQELKTVKTAGVILEVSRLS